MMPEEWPIAAAAADHNAPARPAGRGRLATVRADFFLDPAERLTEQERALMTAMLHGLVGDTADELRALLPNGWAAANDEGNLDLIEALRTTRLLDRPALIALLLRRADEERIATAARARVGRREARMLQGLVSHENGSVAAAAMALILARGRRRDRFGQWLVAFDDLPVETAEALVHMIAAALRAGLSPANTAAAADSALGAAAKQILERHDPSRGLDALTSTLVQRLGESDGLDDELIVAAAHEGEIAFIAQVLARGAGVSGDTAIAELLSGSGRRIVVLFRAAGLSRELAAGLLAGIGDLLGIDDPARALGVFGTMTTDEVDAARAWLASAPAYRDAQAALGRDHG